MFGDKGKRDGVSPVKKRTNSHRNNSTKGRNNKKQLEEQVSKLGSKPEKSSGNFISLLYQYYQDNNDKVLSDKFRISWSPYYLKFGQVPFFIRIINNHQT